MSSVAFFLLCFYPGQHSLGQRVLWRFGFICVQATTLRRRPKSKLLLPPLTCLGVFGDRKTPGEANFETFFHARRSKYYDQRWILFKTYGRYIRAIMQ